MFKHILICTDGSLLANKAAKGGIALAKALRAKVTAYCAFEDLLPIYSEGYEFEQPGCRCWCTAEQQSILPVAMVGACQKLLPVSFARRRFRSPISTHHLTRSQT